MSGSGSKNLVVILCDQLQRQTLGAYGGRIPTPRLDRLAERSAVFQEFYCATPLCVPTRPSMMTGRWPHAHGATTFGPGYETINAGEQLLTDVLMDYGYHVGYEGIWHVNRRDVDQLFDRKADPHEMRDLAQDPNYRAARERNSPVGCMKPGTF